MYSYVQLLPDLVLFQPYKREHLLNYSLIKGTYMPHAKCDKLTIIQLKYIIYINIIYFTLYNLNY